MVSLTVTVGETAYERTIDPDALTLGFLEDLEKAQESGKWRDMIPAFAGLLDLPREAVREITIAQFKAIGAALRDGAAVPNESAPPSA